MTKDVIPLRLSADVAWEKRVHDTYNALPRSRRMEYLRGLLLRGQQALDAEQGVDAGSSAAVAPVASAPAAAVLATVSPAKSGAGASHVKPPVAAAPAAAAPAVIESTPPAQTGSGRSALDVLGGTNFLSAARSSAQTQTPSSQA
jgi:hypothetical protein